MPYAHTSFGELKAMLADQLGDPGMVFWTSTELGVYLIESLRVWGLAANYWRERTTFNTVANQAFYPLQTTLGTTFLGHNVTDRDVFQAIQYSLLESAAAQDNTWAPTEMYTLLQVEGVLNDARNGFLTETGAVLTRSTQVMPAPPIGRTEVSQFIIDVRRLAWIQASDNSYHLLWREDDWSEAAFNSIYESDPTIPYAYMVTGPINIQVSPPPSMPGTLEIIAVEVGAALTPGSAATALGICDNMAPAIKWGALIDLLKGDGQESDPIRMGIATRRWSEMVALAKLSTSIVGANISGSAIMPVTLFDLDAALGNWQTTAAAPQHFALAGHNMAALAPIPDGVYGVQVDIARNAPIPANDAAQVQVGLEDIDNIVNYAEHAALFKVGGEELQESESRIQSFYQAASQYNDKLRADIRFRDMILGHANREEQERPRRQEVTSDARSND